MMDDLELQTTSPEQTQRLGHLLGSNARSGDAFLLTGDLGAGKTTFTQGIAWGLGVKEHARSPTFVLVAQYQGRLPLYHIDLYRIDQLAEAIELGLDEYLQGSGICVVEWAEKALDVLPAEHLSVRIVSVDQTKRRLTVRANGSRYEELLRTVSTVMKSGVQEWS